MADVKRVCVHLRARVHSTIILQRPFRRSDRTCAALFAVLLTTMSLRPSSSFVVPPQGFSRFLCSCFNGPKTAVRGKQDRLGLVLPLGI